jgi:photosystem II stability/assembly factor-like uncharacterized protein
MTTLLVASVNAQWESLPRFSGQLVAVGSIGDTLFVSASPALGDTIKVLRSTDYGGSWTRVGQSIPTSDFAGVQAFTTIGHTIYAASGQDGIYRSTDGGTTWTPTGSPPFLAITYSLASNGDTLFAGHYGVAWSTNGGSTWTQPDIGPPPSITTSVLHVGSTLFAASQGVSRSTNGGRNWTAVNNGLPSLDTYYLASLGSSLFVTIPGSGLFRSTNLGVSWEPSLVGDTVSYSTNVVSAAPYLIASTDYGIYVSRDTGKTWRSSGYSNLVQFNQLLVAGPYLYGGNLARHALANFFPAATATRLIDAPGTISFDEPGNVTGISMNLSSVTGVALVTVRRLTDPPANPAFAGPSPAYVSQYRWVISTEGALNVTGEIRINLSAFQSGITQPSDVHIYRRSSSGSGDFVEIPTTYDPVANELVGTITGFSEFVLGSASGPLDVINGLHEQPADYALYQNFPNPFNPETVIQYYLPAGGYVSLKVYNILGQEVAVLVEGIERAGTGSVIFKMESLPSGLYYYKLRTESFTATRRMLLVR